jgi:hypothetical protein
MAMGYFGQPLISTSAFQDAKLKVSSQQLTAIAIVHFPSIHPTKVFRHKD